MTKKEKQEKKEKLKNRIIKVVNVCSYILTSIFILTMIISCCSTKNNKNNNSEVLEGQRVRNQNVITNIGNTENDRFLRYDTENVYYYSDSGGDRSYHDNLFSYLATYDNLNFDFIIFMSNASPTIYSNVSKVNVGNSYSYFLLDSEGQTLFNYNVQMPFDFAIQFKSDIYINNNAFLTIQKAFSKMVYTTEYNDGTIDSKDIYYVLPPILEFDISISSLNIYFYGVYEGIQYSPSESTTNEVNVIRYAPYSNLEFAYESNYQNEVQVIYGYPYNDYTIADNNNIRYAFKNTYMTDWVDNVGDYAEPSDNYNSNARINNVIALYNSYRYLNNLFYRNGELNRQVYYFMDIPFGVDISNVVNPYINLATLTKSIRFTYFVNNGYMISGENLRFREINLFIKRVAGISGLNLIQISIQYGRVDILNTLAFVVANNNMRFFTDIDIEFGSAYSENNVRYINHLDIYRKVEIYGEIQYQSPSLIVPPTSVNSFYYIFGLFYNLTIYNTDFGGTDSDLVADLDNVFLLISSALMGLLPFLNINIFPFITIGTLVLVPLLITILIFIIKLFKR